MPRIFDNIDLELLPAIRSSLEKAHRADFCVGYFNLRGWRYLADLVDPWLGSDGHQARVLVGMPVDQDRELQDMFSLYQEDQLLDRATVLQIKQRMARKFRDQLMFGVPEQIDEAGLRLLAKQLREGKVRVKLHARYKLHAKLYLAFRDDADNPITAYLGSSNLTLAGLKHQGELNVDVLDHDATQKLRQWFEDRWNDPYSIDITEELIAIIGDSWITPRTPYQIYIKMAYHLSREAREGVELFRIPPEFKGKLFTYQELAVKIATQHLVRRGGVLLGDVVGLGKTIMATCVAKMFIEAESAIPLIICPPKLIPMWERYSRDYELYARVLSLGQVRKLKGDFSRHRLVIIDESHNLRNRESRTYAFVRDYIEEMGARVILLSATPYNKGYEDISSQLRLFLADDQSLGVRPENYLRKLENGEADFGALHQCPVDCIRAFEHSSEKEDWQQLLQKYMVRRTRSFIKRVYAEPKEGEGRKYLPLSDGTRAYFPDRVPHTVEFEFDSANPSDPYAKLFNTAVVDTISALTLPRYGLGNYVRDDAGPRAASGDTQALKNLGIAGKRLMGFCRTNLYKRLESSGEAFILSVDRHILRNYLFLHALEQGLPIPIGTQDPAMLDSAFDDDDDEQLPFDDEDTPAEDIPIGRAHNLNAEAHAKYRARAAELYGHLAGAFKNRFTWLSASYFEDRLSADLIGDAQALLDILKKVPVWPASQDRKLDELKRLLTEIHRNDKVLIFTQFADTANYLKRELDSAGIGSAEVVTGGSSDVTEIARRFSPRSNHATDVRPGDELRIVIATDVLSEGQNLQDAHVIVNFDLPWALIRLVQRAGRVDRIGQQHETIDAYTFVPMKGVDDIIKLRKKVRNRIKQNAEVVGSDESHFDDDGSDTELLDLYHEKSGILDGKETETDVDLQSRAYQIYQEAIDRDPALATVIEKMPDVVYSGKARDDHAQGVLVYVRTPDDNDSLAYIGTNGQSLTENQAEILNIAKCDPETPTSGSSGEHHRLVRCGVAHLLERERSMSGSLGRKNGARYRTYMLIKAYLEAHPNDVTVPTELNRALELIHKRPLREAATSALNSQFRQGADTQRILDLVLDLYDERKLCYEEDAEVNTDPRIICSMGLI